MKKKIVLGIVGLAVFSAGLVGMKRKWEEDLPAWEDVFEEPMTFEEEPTLEPVTKKARLGTEGYQLLRVFENAAQKNDLQTIEREIEQIVAGRNEQAFNVLLDAVLPQVTKKYFNNVGDALYEILLSKTIEYAPSLSTQVQLAIEQIKPELRELKEDSLHKTLVTKAVPQKMGEQRVSSQAGQTQIAKKHKEGIAYKDMPAELWKEIGEKYSHLGREESKTKVPLLGELGMLQKGAEIVKDIEKFVDAAVRGDLQTVQKMYEQKRVSYKYLYRACLQLLNNKNTDPNVLNKQKITMLYLIKKGQEGKDVSKIGSFFVPTDFKVDQDISFITSAIVNIVGHILKNKNSDFLAFFLNACLPVLLGYAFYDYPIKFFGQQMSVGGAIAGSKTKDVLQHLYYKYQHVKGFAQIINTFNQTYEANRQKLDQYIKTLVLQAEFGTFDNFKKIYNQLEVDPYLSAVFNIRHRLGNTLIGLISRRSDKSPFLNFLQEKGITADIR